MKFNKLILLTSFGIIGFTVLAIRPINSPTKTNCSILKGQVIEIYESGVNDVVFKLQGHNEEFYINRGLERGLDLNKLKADLMTKSIVLTYPNHWTPLDPFNSVRHISEVALDEKLIFSEFKD